MVRQGSASNWPTVTAKNICLAKFSDASKYIKNKTRFAAISNSFSVQFESRRFFFLLFPPRHINSFSSFAVASSLPCQCPIPPAAAKALPCLAHKLNKNDKRVTCFQPLFALLDLVLAVFIFFSLSANFHQFYYTNICGINQRKSGERVD